MTERLARARHPVIGISVHVEAGQHRCRSEYATAVTEAGAAPILLPPVTGMIPEYLSICDGIVTSGGDDPLMEVFGQPTHPKAKPVDPRRQEFELALLDALAHRSHPLLAVCLGMQYMALHAGGTLDQHLPETLESADLHWGGTPHEVTGELGSGPVHSHHRQAITDPGTLEVVATAEDRVIEGVRDPGHPFRVGVQWHPERTGHAMLGAGLFRGLVEACSDTSAGRG